MPRLLRALIVVVVLLIAAGCREDAPAPTRSTSTVPLPGDERVVSPSTKLLVRTSRLAAVLESAGYELHAVVNSPWLQMHTFGFAHDIHAQRDDVSLPQR